MSRRGRVAVALWGTAAGIAALCAADELRCRHRAKAARRRDLDRQLVRLYSVRERTARAAGAMAGRPAFPTVVPITNWRNP